ncbi:MULTISPECIES: YidB family protein [unclassified Moraxella]|uniref:YidB family protein n=1 Tax=unclassified Moraxella TaxID=2685852 RepID=UPI00359E7FBF
MSLLQSIVTQVVQNALNDNNNTQGNTQHTQQQGGLGGMLGSLVGQQNNNTGLGGILGQVLGSQMGANANQDGLGGLLGGLLGGQTQNRQASPTDLGGILGSLLGGQTQAQGRQSVGFNKSTLLLALLPIVLNYIQKNGGLSGVLAKFQGGGLGNHAQSWVSIDRDNDGIDAGDIARLFDSQDIKKVCSQTGASEQEVCQGIAELLPQVVNDLTPQGGLNNEKEANDEIDQILAQLKGRF